ncbi:TetR/AcrR family transcriptional regulator [Mycobacterium paraintracellulare]|uniref:TetR/AcrR family transcriptional regulator n=1 Tax=Mycobacterium paraintracellulare TaxID=1138383 RepID=UPI001927B1CF|nr:TetR/AcrR family transcriptional regulator [Mycobacterium paraintracellulare]BCP14272.1 TetR family transcriptional regulator [Mycobacterium paraintracellulare]
MIPRTVPERRWGGKKRVDDEDAARERLLDAAEECFNRLGASRTSIEDVARQAKVSRSTVYRYFEGRNELLAAAYMRQNTAVFERVKILMAEQGTFAERVVRVTVRAINALRSGRFFPMLFNSDGALMSSQAIIASKMFYEAGRATMQPFFEEARSRGEIPVDLDLEDFIEWHLRLIFSFAMFDSPAPRDQASLTHLLETFIAPPFNARPDHRGRSRR